jgi:hypothetical protein
MVGVAQGDAAYPRSTRHHDGSVHRREGIEVSRAELSIPSLEGPRGRNKDRRSFWIYPALPYCIDESRKAFEPMGIDSFEARHCEEAG